MIGELWASRALLSTEKLWRISKNCSHSSNKINTVQIYFWKRKNTIHICIYAFSKICFRNTCINAIHWSSTSNLNPRKKKTNQEGERIYRTLAKVLQETPIHLVPFSSIDDSEAVSSIVEFEIVSDWLPFSLSEAPDGLSSTGCFRNQYMILAVSVRIIFWFTWWSSARYKIRRKKRENRYTSVKRL